MMYAEFLILCTLKIQEWGINLPVWFPTKRSAASLVISVVSYYYNHLHFGVFRQYQKE